MSYTTNRQPQGPSTDIDGFLREGLIAEIVAINDYSHFIKLTDNKEVREIFHHILEDEKRHYGLFLQALRKVDKEQAEMSIEALEHVRLSKKDKNKYNDYSGFKGGRGDVLTFIRENIKGELEAILLYEKFVENIDDHILVSLIKSIIKDEKEHVEELTRAMVILDKDEYGPIG